MLRLHRQILSDEPTEEQVPINTHFWFYFKEMSLNISILKIFFFFIIILKINVKLLL